MPLFRNDTANPDQRHAPVWALSALLILAMAAVCGAFAHPVDRSSIAADAALHDASSQTGDRETPPQRIADECTASIKRRRVCSDWLAVAIGPERASLTLHRVPDLPLERAARRASSTREVIAGGDAFRVEPCNWSAMRLRVCRGRAPPIS